MITKVAGKHGRNTHFSDQILMYKYLLIFGLTYCICSIRISLYCIVNVIFHVYC